MYRNFFSSGNTGTFADVEPAYFPTIFTKTTPLSLTPFGSLYISNSNSTTGGQYSVALIRLATLATLISLEFQWQVTAFSAISRGTGPRFSLYVNANDAINMTGTEYQCFAGVESKYDPGSSAFISDFAYASQRDAIDTATCRLHNCVLGCGSTCVFSAAVPAIPFVNNMTSPWLSARYSIAPTGVTMSISYDTTVVVDHTFSHTAPLLPNIALGTYGANVFVRNLLVTSEPIATSSSTTQSPTSSPTSPPMTKSPTSLPTSLPTTKSPTSSPTSLPTTKSPTSSPTYPPTTTSPVQTSSLMTTGTTPSPTQNPTTTTILTTSETITSFISSTISSYTKIPPIPVAPPLAQPHPSSFLVMSLIILGCYGIALLMTHRRATREYRVELQRRTLRAVDRAQQRAARRRKPVDTFNVAFFEELDEVDQYDQVPMTTTMLVRGAAAVP